MPDVIFEEIECKSAINRVHAGNMPFRWTLNPYRGCQHACTYCFARASHEFLGYDAGRDFETRIVVKVNAPEMLRRDLARPGWGRELIAIGTACDPYQAAELKYSLTHRVSAGAARLREPGEHRHQVAAHRPRRRRARRRCRASRTLTVNFSISTLDEDVWKRIEPGTAKPSKRLQAMEALAERGIRCGVMLAPILPGLTDDPQSLERVVEAAREHGASFVHDNVLYLKPGTKEWFMPFLREAYPHLSERYAKYYRGAYAPRTYTQDVHRVLERLRCRYGLAPPAAVRPTAGQLQLAM